MSNSESFTVRAVQERDLGLLLAWRNHPTIRSYMLTRHIIEVSEHLAWFERASKDDRKKMLVVERSGTPIGYVHFDGVGDGAIADWGFYAAPGAPRGSGREIGRAALRLAFGALSLHKVCGQALAFNTASIRLHLALGFRQEGVLREQHRQGDAYHDMLCFGLLGREWTLSTSAGDQP